jgi:hypothetical protein
MRGPTSNWPKDEILANGSAVVYIAAGKGRPVARLESEEVSRAASGVILLFLLDEDRTLHQGLWPVSPGWGLTPYNIAHPASMVVDRDRTIRYIYRGRQPERTAPRDGRS